MPRCSSSRRNPEPAEGRLDNGRIPNAEANVISEYKEARSNLTKVKHHDKEVNFKASKLYG